MLRKTAVLAFSTLLAGCVPMAQAQAQERVEAGVLDCAVESGGTFLFGSTRDVQCTFFMGDDRLPTPYFGIISRWGIDLGSAESTRMVWTVLAATSDLDAGVLVGDYVGVSASAALGIGAGANVLVGGSDESVVLQPLSVQAQEGVNLALGVAELQLRSMFD